MNSEFKKLKESVLTLISKLPEDSIRVKLLNIEYLLLDYDFLEDAEELGNLNPVNVLNRYLGILFKR